MKAKNLFLILIASILLFSCKGSDDASPVGAKHNVQINLSSYSVTSFSPLDLIFPKAHAAVSNLKFCFKRLRFKLSQSTTTNHSGSSDNIDITPGYIDISSSGASIVNVPVLAGTYTRVEFDLERDCDGSTKNSTDLTNTNGTYTSTDRITIKFDGSFTVDGSKSVSLGIQNILDQANSFDNLGGVSLKESLESVSGNL